MHEELTIEDQAAGLRQLASARKAVHIGTERPLVTVTSGKGGVGKSTVALNLAKKLAEFGQKILLVDADTNLGNLDVMLGVSPTYRLGNVLRDELDVEDALVSPADGLKLLAGNSGDLDYPLMNLEEHNRLLELLRATEERFDLIIMDTAAGLTREVVNAIVHSTEVIVVTNPEPTSVMDAYAVMKVVWASNPELPMGFLMNGVRVPAQADEAAEKLQLALKHFLNAQAAYLGSIPYDECVSKAIVQQVPVVDRYSRSSAALSLQAFAQAFVRNSVSCRKGRRSVSA